jgi:hypothetical protein
MLKWTKTEKLVKSSSRRASNFESQSPVNDECLDALKIFIKRFIKRIFYAIFSNLHIKYMFFYK